MRAKIALSATVCLSLLTLQPAHVSVSMKLAKAFLVGLATILAVFDDVVLVIRHIHSAEAVHIVIYDYQVVLAVAPGRPYQDNSRRRRCTMTRCIVLVKSG